MDTRYSKFGAKYERYPLIVKNWFNVVKTNRTGKIVVALEKAISIIRGGTQKFPELLKKMYLKYLYKFETLVPFEAPRPLRMYAAVSAPLPTEMLSRAASESLAALDSISVEDFRQCFQYWERCWDCCIQSQGEYFEGD